MLFSHSYGRSTYSAASARLEIPSSSDEAINTTARAPDDRVPSRMVESSLQSSLRAEERGLMCSELIRTGFTAYFAGLGRTHKESYPTGERKQLRKCSMHAPAAQSDGGVDWYQVAGGRDALVLPPSDRTSQKIRLKWAGLIPAHTEFQPMVAPVSSWWLHRYPCSKVWH